jgi:hypothetical protein
MSFSEPQVPIAPPKSHVLEFFLAIVSGLILLISTISLNRVTAIGDEVANIRVQQAQQAVQLQELTSLRQDMRAMLQTVYDLQLRVGTLEQDHRRNTR